MEQYKLPEYVVVRRDYTPGHWQIEFLEDVLGGSSLEEAMQAAINQRPVNEPKDWATPRWRVVKVYDHTLYMPVEDPKTWTTSMVQVTEANAKNRADCNWLDRKGW